jgi:hypothetical protein
MPAFLVDVEPDVKILESVYRCAPKLLSVVSGSERCSSYDSTGLHGILNRDLKKWGCLKIGRRKNLTEKLGVHVGEIEMPINVSYIKMNSAYGVSLDRSWRGLFSDIIEI